MLLEPLHVSTVVNHVGKLILVYHVVEITLFKLWQRFVGLSVADFIIWVHKWPRLRCWVNCYFGLRFDNHVQSVDHLDGVVFLDDIGLTKHLAADISLLLCYTNLCIIGSILKIPVFKVA